MSDFSLVRESIEEIIDYDVQVLEFENSSEQRRLINPNKVIGFSITTPDLTKTQMQSYRNFLISKYGPLTSFTFTSPFDDVEYTVRFEQRTFQTLFVNGYFKCSFKFKVLP